MRRVTKLRTNNFVAYYNRQRWSGDQLTTAMWAKLMFEEAKKEMIFHRLTGRIKYVNNNNNNNN